MFRKMPFVLVSIILAIVLLDPIMPFVFKQVLYALSLSIKSVIVFLLPVIIFGLLFKASVTLAHSATRVIGFILVGVCVSNFVSTFLSHYVGIWIYHLDLPLVTPKDAVGGLDALWSFALPKLIANDKAMFLGIGLGVGLAMWRADWAHQVSLKLERVVSLVVQSFAWLIPFFVAGFIVKLQHDGVVTTIVKDYTIVFAVVALAQFSYIALLYFLANGMNVSSVVANLKSMFPAAIAGFSTMSSAAAMPLTLMGVEKNVENKDLARSVIPATVNIHLIGDCFAIPIFAYAVLKNYGIAEPALMAYIIFSLYFVLAKFSVAAIPGGGIIVMLPILESYLGFNAEMMSLITALYILFDPVITCANVLGNGAFAKLVDKRIPMPKATPVVTDVP